jgi:hypothetical protein
VRRMEFRFWNFMLEIKKEDLKRKTRSDIHSKVENKKKRKRDVSMGRKVFEEIEKEIHGTEKRNGEGAPHSKS